MSKKKLILLFIFLIVSGFITYFLTFLYFPNQKYFHREGKVDRVKWVEITGVPKHKNKYKPQGLTWIKGFLIFSNHWNDTNSRVYKIDPDDNMKVLAYFDMPSEAVHTSGLGWDGNHLWAVDHISNKIYKLDMETSFKEKKAKVIGTIDSMLKGLSACAFIDFKGKKHLIYSDFRNTEKNYIIDQEKALVEKTVKNSILASFENGGFSQGLTWTGKYLLDSNNRIGTDIIYCLDIEKAIEGKTYTKAIIQIIEAPHTMVEDMAYHEGKIWISDEASYYFYSTEEFKKENKK